MGHICSTCEEETPLHLLVLHPLLATRGYTHSEFSGRAIWGGIPKGEAGMAWTGGRTQLAQRQDKEGSALA